MEDHVQPIGLDFITMRERFLCNLKEERVLVNAKQKKKVRKINGYSQYIVISENILHSIL